MGYYGLACTIQRTLLKIHLRQALFSQPCGLPASPEGSFGGCGSWCHSTGYYRSGDIAERQVAAPYAGKDF